MQELETQELYREVLNEHNLNPSHKKMPSFSNYKLNGVNPSCGDDITLYLNISDNKIVSGSFTGQGCAVSQASCDMMLDLIIGKSVEEAKTYSAFFTKMINGTATDEEIEALEEAGLLQGVSKMPARVKCALLGWRTLNTLLDSGKLHLIQEEGREDCSTCPLTNCNKK